MAEVHVSHDANGEEWQAAVIDVDHIKNHPHLDVVRNAVQNVLSSTPSAGIRASVGILNKDVEARVAEGVDPVDIADKVQNVAIAKWAEAALRAGRLEQQVAPSKGPDGSPATTFTVQAVLFTDTQFGEFCVALETELLNAVDAIVEAALAADRAAR